MINMKNIINKIKTGFINVTKFFLGLQSKLIPATDKLGHFYWGAIYAFLTDLITDNIFIILVPLMFAISKELRDRVKDEKGISLGNFEWADIFWTVLPGILFFYS